MRKKPQVNYRAIQVKGGGFAVEVTARMRRNMRPFVSGTNVMSAFDITAAKIEFQAPEPTAP